MNDWLRRHARWVGLSLIVLLAAGSAYVLLSAGSARARPAGRVAQVRAIAPVLAPAARRRAGGVRSQAAVSHTRRVRTAAPRRSVGRPEVPTPAPSRRGVSLALRHLTGLAPAQLASRPVCPRPAPGHATCAAQVLVLRSNGALVHPHVARYRTLGHVRPALASGAHPASDTATTPPQPDTPAYLQQAYDVSYLSQQAGAGDTVAVVDAHDDPSAESDLKAYRLQYDLPACTTANGCFRKVGQNGGSTLPTPDATWEQEIALDLDAVSAICPQCHILLVEANSNTFSDLEAAMTTAANAKPTPNQISASWWGVSSTVPSGLRTFSGIATVAATGDGGYAGPGEDNYPAALPGVTAAGGTSLGAPSAPSARGFGEAAWSWNGVDGGGSGCDVQFSRPSYQPAAGCAGRAYADLSADADPNTGLAVYNQGNWSLVGGTSLSAPLIAGYYAITGVASATPQWAYGDTGTLNDIQSGSSGSCAPSIAYICNAGSGYDGPTGVGSISGSVVLGAPGIGGPSLTSSSGNTYVTSVSAHGATITGGIYRNGLDTKWWIQYGSTTSYGQQTPATDIGAGSAPVTVTGNLSRLNAGTAYHFRLVAQNSLGTAFGPDDTFTTQPGPAGGPTASFALTSTPTPGAPASFDASSSTAGTVGSISDYSWNFGDGTGPQDAGASASTSHTYGARGTYTVTLTITTSSGQTDTSAQTVTVDAAPSVRLTPSSRAVPAGTTIAFNAGASSSGSGGSITDYSWNFGDGSNADTGTNAMQSHKFATPGTYTVTLTATDDLAVTSTATAQITVAPFTATQAAPNSPVTFTALNPPSGSTLSWDFGDKTPPSSGASTTHTYTTRGDYLVTLTVQSNGTSTSSTATVIVDTAPTAQFTSSSAAVRPGSPVGFDASASNVTDGSIADYSWNFGDGSPTQDTETSATTSHAFAARGVYTVTLTTTDDLGSTTSTAQQVTVDEPTAAFSVSTPNPAPNAPVSFDASATADPESSVTDYSWNFGDGTTADTGPAAGATHTFTARGTYTVTLSVTDQLGFTATTSRQVLVTPASTQSTGTPPPVAPPVPSPVPAPPAPPPGAGSAPPSGLVAKLTGAGRQRLRAAMAHGLRLGLVVNQRTRASFQITIPMAQTREDRSAKGKRTATVVLLRGAQAFAAGHHTITLKLSKSAARRLAPRGALVLTVRVTLVGASGTKVTRTAKIRLTR